MTEYEETLDSISEIRGKLTHNTTY